MGISFDSLPANLRTPGVYIEFDNTLASAASQGFRMLVIGQRLAAGTVAAGVPTLVTTREQGATYFGAGSMLAVMIGMMLAANTSIELWAIALDDNPAGVKAAGTIAVSTPPSADGTLYLYIGGVRIAVAVAATNTAANVATAIAAAVTATVDAPVSAAVNGTVTTQVDLSAKHKGEFGNDIDLRHGYYGEQLPAGLTLAIGAMATGAGNPDIAAAITAMADDWYNWIACPYRDVANLTALTAELDDRWGPLQQIDGRAFIAYRGTLAATGTFGNGRNSPHLTCMGTHTAPQPPYIWAAVNCAVAAASLAIDPARPLQTLVLKGLLSPARQDRWIQSERNTLLYDGIATYTVDSGGQVRIERQITTYQKNDAGLDDASYLDIQTPETLSRIRFRQRQMFASQYPRHKLADDDTRYGAGQAIITPSIARGELLALYRQFEAAGWAEDYADYESRLVVERDAADRNRLNYRDTPNLVNQLRVIAGKTQFIV